MKGRIKEYYTLSRHRIDESTARLSGQALAAVGDIYPTDSKALRTDADTLAFYTSQVALATLANAERERERERANTMPRHETTLADIRRASDSPT